MPDIQSRQDIELLVDAFYKRVLEDEQIKVFFTKVVSLDWDVHIPVMYDFWESMLLDVAKYRRNAMLKHLELNERRRLESAHFDRWLELWEETVKAHFEGEKASKAISKARQIGELMQFKLNSLTPFK